MNNSNWPFGTNLGHGNFTGRVARTMQGGGWADDSDKIPNAAWAWAVVFAAVMVAVMFVGHAVYGG